MSLDDAVSRFGASLKAKLSGPAISGAPEDQLRGPLETLIKDVAAAEGFPAQTVELIGETTLAGLATRPDFAVTVRKTLIGFIEVKAPGKGADPRRFTGDHDRKQFDKLRSLPNILYTDGESFAVFRNGALDGAVVHLSGDLATAGVKLAAPPALSALIVDFLRWTPQPPRTVKELAETSARLCRLLRQEVREQLEQRHRAFTVLADDWRTLLFPQASDDEFADGYAQAVTFGLLVARARDIDLAHGIDAAALELRKSNSLIGNALRLLIDDPDAKTAVKTSLDTLLRVLSVVEWTALTRGGAEPWLYFYEDFLAVYDNVLRRKTGSYYTPPEVVEAMVRLVDEALRDPKLFARPLGLAAPDVTVADPAVGTGTFLLGVLRRIADNVTADKGAGAVPGAIAAAAQRLIGFEMQFGPFAVAQLRLMAEVASLMSVGPGAGGNLPGLRLYVTDTLGDPYAQETQLPAMVAAIGHSRQEANRIKREEPITVVIGNPPYKIDAAGQGGWIEAGSAGRPSAMALWSPPRDWGVGAHAKHLKNLYVFFWRWATWKVFGSGHAATTGGPDTDRSGIVCFITVAGFLNGPGFQKMRDDLRRDCSDIWVIDCSPEGHQPEVATRIFQGVQQPVCIVLAVRPAGKDRTVPARVRCRALPAGRRDDKFTALSGLGLNDAGWSEADTDFRSAFLPERAGHWASFVALPEVFEWSTPGVKTHRTWVIAPDAPSLARRWDVLQRETDRERRRVLFHEDRDRTLGRTVSVGLGRHATRPTPVERDTSGPIEAARFAFRSFDRQWILPDHRLLSQARPELWSVSIDQQIFMTAINDYAPSTGPAISFCSHIPDQHHYNGRGGRVFPLWRDAAATVPNVKPALTVALSRLFARAVAPGEVMAYVAALLAHPGFTARFRADLVRPGLRVPFTADAALFDAAVRIGERVIWLHTYGERCVDPAAGRPAGPPRLPAGEGPTIPAGGGIPGAPEPLPDDMRHDAATSTLFIGRGRIERVPQAVFDYEVSGKVVLRQWFSYRKRDRSRPIIGDRRPPSPLDAIQPDHWPQSYTDDLIDLLHVLGLVVRLEPEQDALLERVLASPLLDAGRLGLSGEA